jgi:2-iminobutanoate/2-iminopropanoate deaminase
MDLNGKLAGETITEKTELCIKNLQAVLTAAGSSIGNVVKTTVFLADMSSFAVRSPLSGSLVEANKLDRR